MPQANSVFFTKAEAPETGTVFKKKPENAKSHYFLNEQRKNKNDNSLQLLRRNKPNTDKAKTGSADK